MGRSVLWGNKDPLRKSLKPRQTAHPGPNHHCRVPLLRLWIFHVCMCAHAHGHAHYPVTSLPRPRSLSHLKHFLLPVWLLHLGVLHDALRLNPSSSSHFPNILRMLSPSAPRKNQPGFQAKSSGLCSDSFFSLMISASYVCSPNSPSRLCATVPLQTARLS